MSATNMEYEVKNATAAQHHGIAIDAPSKGEIKKAVVVQLTGSLDGFDYTFFDSEAGCKLGIFDDDTVFDKGADARSQICATRTVPNGKDRDQADGGFGSLGFYQNADGGLSNSQHKLYVRLFVRGTGTKTFGIYLGIAPTK